MHDQTFASHYDAGESTLELRGFLGQEHWPQIHEEVDRAFRRTACRLTVDLTRVEHISAHTVGRIVHLCNSRYPGTLVRLPIRGQAPAIA